MNARRIQRGRQKRLKKSRKSAGREEELKVETTMASAESEKQQAGLDVGGGLRNGPEEKAAETFPSGVTVSFMAQYAAS